MAWFLAMFCFACLVSQAQTITETFGSGVNQFQIEFVTIGNPGNAADTTGSPNPAGSVGYIYNLGKYEVNRDMITQANLAGILGITMSDLSSYGGNSANRPATGLSWYAAARFVNYLNTSTANSPAYKFDGNGKFQLWTPGDLGYQSNNPFRSALAKYFLPSSDEWYKAAYGSPAGTWHNYPTGSDFAPTGVAAGTVANSAVYGGQFGPADFDKAGGFSPWGTMAQAGNVWEWIETAFDGINDAADDARELRGGSWNSTFLGDAAASERRLQTGAETFNYGFRIAMVPEPSSSSLLLAGGAMLMAGRRRNRD